MQRMIKGWPFAGLLAIGGLVCASGLWAEDAPKPQTPSSAKPATPQPAAASEKQEAASSAMIQDNMEVQLEYTLSADGQVVDSTEGHGPFRYVHGMKQIIPGLERQLAGLHVGDAKEITVTPNEGYGPVDPAAVIDVPREQLPADTKPETGMVLRGVDPDGRAFRATVQDVKEKTVKLNLNHPLAGKTLVFKIKVVDITPAKL